MLFDRSKKKNHTVYTLGAGVLREKARPVERIDDTLRQLALEMAETMLVFDGIGLAAPQFGESLRLVVLGVPQERNSGTPGEQLLLPQMPLALVNPEIIVVSDEKSEYDEGCLSLPGIYGTVVRPQKVVLRTQLLNGEFVEVECGGLLARCVQHELDHLDGVVFSDRLAPDELRKVRGDLDRLIKAGKSKNFRKVIKK